jgi:hypothetical protein
VAVVPDTSGDGYWLVTSTGGVYAFGDATYYGGTTDHTDFAGKVVTVTAAAADPSGSGYWLAFSDGTVQAFGGAWSPESDPPIDPVAFNVEFNPLTAIVPTGSGGGYWLVSSAGWVAPYGDATAQGSLEGDHLDAPIIAAAGG